MMKMQTEGIILIRTIIPSDLDLSYTFPPTISVALLHDMAASSSTSVQKKTMITA